MLVAIVLKRLSEADGGKASLIERLIMVAACGQARSSLNTRRTAGGAGKLFSMVRFRAHAMAESLSTGLTAAGEQANAVRSAL